MSAKCHQRKWKRVVTALPLKRRQGNTGVSFATGVLSDLVVVQTDRHPRGAAAGARRESKAGINGPLLSASSRRSRHFGRSATGNHIACAAVDHPGPDVGGRALLDVSVNVICRPRTHPDRYTTHYPCSQKAGFVEECESPDSCRDAYHRWRVILHRPPIDANVREPIIFLCDEMNGSTISVLNKKILAGPCASRQQAKEKN